MIKLNKEISIVEVNDSDGISKEEILLNNVIKDKNALIYHYSTTSERYPTSNEINILAKKLKKNVVEFDRTNKLSSANLDNYGIIIYEKK
jgi:hypothetical protein